jgi:hypothetical protein
MIIKGMVSVQIMVINNYLRFNQTPTLSQAAIIATGEGGGLSLLVDHDLPVLAACDRQTDRWMDLR